MNNKRYSKITAQSRASYIQQPHVAFNTNYQEKLARQTLRIMLLTLVLASLVVMIYSLIDKRPFDCIIPHLFIIPFYTILYIITVYNKRANIVILSLVAVMSYAFVIFPGLWWALSFTHPMTVGLAAFILIISILLFEGKIKKIVMAVITAMLAVLMIINIVQTIQGGGGFGNIDTGVFLSIAVTIGMVAYCTYGFKEKFREMNAALQKTSVTDSLTGAYNTRMMAQMVARYTERFNETGQVFAISVVDMDEFKRINDLFGHDTGDDYLVTTVRVMQDSLRDGDILARIGGDEFAMLLPNCTAMQAKRIIQRLLHAVGEIRVADGIKNISFSAGVTDSVEAKKLGLDLFKIADQKLYHSKALGRNRVFADALPKRRS